eukprot:TRINITY_DN6945_c1_g1_i1.p1 TRINITY_DN6945_c1_g1~~TRINITY_DN6945_c1_g1_i1.p1  ORF type:complete len:221 (-),score=37.17 TRINITY_DN6945_c1_g1_i1:50-712(-)
METVLQVFTKVYGDKHVPVQVLKKALRQIDAKTFDDQFVTDVFGQDEGFVDPFGFAAYLSGQSQSTSFLVGTAEGKTTAIEHAELKTPVAKEPATEPFPEGWTVWSDSQVENLGTVQLLIDAAGVREGCESRARRKFLCWKVFDFRTRRNGTLRSLEYQIHVGVSEPALEGDTQVTEVAELTLRVSEAKDGLPVCQSFICTGAFEGEYSCLSMFYIQRAY